MTLRRLGNIAAIVLCIAAFIVVNAASRDRAEFHWYRGAMGEQVVTPRMDVTVERAVITDHVIAGYTELTTDHTFLVVEWSATAKGRRAAFGSADVTLTAADGTRAEQRRDLLSTGNLPPASPGFTSSGVSVFEVPEERLDGAAFEIRDHHGLFTAYAPAIRVEGIVDEDTERVDQVEIAPGTVEVRR